MANHSDKNRCNILCLRFLLDALLLELKVPFAKSENFATGSGETPLEHHLCNRKSIERLSTVLMSSSPSFVSIITQDASSSSLSSHAFYGIYEISHPGSSTNTCSAEISSCFGFFVLLTEELKCFKMCI